MYLIVTVCKIFSTYFVPLLKIDYLKLNVIKNNFKLNLQHSESATLDFQAQYLRDIET